MTTEEKNNCGCLKHQCEIAFFFVSMAANFIKILDFAALCYLLMLQYNYAIFPAVG